MPAEALERTAAPALDGWLDALAPLLAPLQPERLALIGGLVLPHRLQWVDRLPDEVEAIEPAERRALPKGGGWLIPLDPHGERPTLLFLMTRHEEPVGEMQMQATASLCRAAWRLRLGPQAAGDDDSRAVGEAVHALRNGLNSVLMSAAVITTCAHMLPDRLQPIAREIEAAAQRSVERLHKLTALIDTLR